MHWGRYVPLALSLLALFVSVVWLFISDNTSLVTKPNSSKAENQMREAQPAKTSTQNQEPASDAQPNRTHEVPNPSSGTIQTQSHAQQPYYGWDVRRTTPYERWYLVGTGLVVLITGIYAFYAYRQWTVLNDSLNLSRESLEQGRQSLQISNRPWLGVTGMPGKLEQHPFTNSPGFVMTANIPYKNFWGIARTERYFSWHDFYNLGASLG